MRYPYALLPLAIAVTATAPATARAWWPHDPQVNVAISTLPSAQVAPVVLPDGAGGAFIVWSDARNDGGDLFAQRVDSRGTPQWAPNGVPVCVANGVQAHPVVVVDAGGGFIVAWEDDRGATLTDVYAQRVNGEGSTLWLPGGVPLCVAANTQGNLAIVPDGEGGAIVVWEDFRSFVNDIYGQRVVSTGQPVWTASGTAICAETNHQIEPAIATSDYGGVVVSWADLRNGSWDIYAQKLGSAGNALWTAGGVAVCTQASQQEFPAMVADGSGGAMIVWQDERGGVTSEDLYVQHVNLLGAKVWSMDPDGRYLTMAAGPQTRPVAVSDGDGGIIVAWQDGRNGLSDISLNRVISSGYWAGGFYPSAMCGTGFVQGAPALAADGAGGSIVAWTDARDAGDVAIYAQRFDPLGEPRWGVGGKRICAAAGTQYAPAVGTDAAGRSVVAWTDLRGGSADVYAQNVDFFGALGHAEPTATSCADLPNDTGGAFQFTWSASYLEASSAVVEYRVWRSVPPQWAAKARASRIGLTRDPDEAFASGRLLAHVVNGSEVAFEYVGTVAATQAGSYSYPVPTAGDSSAWANPLTIVMAQARGTGPPWWTTPYWYSAPDSGYSVDNFPPATPSPFTGVYDAGTTRLFWDPNVEPDLAGYRLYRGSNPLFVPAPENQIAAQADTGYVDVAGYSYFYKITAVDVLGQESPPALFDPGGATAVGERPEAAFALLAPSPNPARAAALLRFALPRAMAVRLAMYDAAGRHVLTVHDGPLPAGEHVQRLALADRAGRPLPSGLYLLRMEADGRALTRRLTVCR